MESANLRAEEEACFAVALTSGRPVIPEAEEKV
jgi:hypothetical protein